MELIEYPCSSRGRTRGGRSSSTGQVLKTVQCDDAIKREAVKRLETLSMFHFRSFKVSQIQYLKSLASCRELSFALGLIFVDTPEFPNYRRFYLFSGVQIEDVHSTRRRTCTAILLLLPCSPYIYPIFKIPSLH